MDKSDCDLPMLYKTYKSFRTINKLLSGWRLIYKREIFPFLNANNGSATLLDIGFGGGDIPILLSDLAEKDGFSLSITAIDPDDRSVEFATNTYQKSSVTFLNQHSSDLVKQNKKFHFVISNHLLHHLDNQQLNDLCNDAQRLVTHKVLFNDILRSSIGYGAFFVLSKLFFHGSFISYDGLMSIKRSFKPIELEQICPEDWTIDSLFPYRLLLTYES